MNLLYFFFFAIFVHNFHQQCDDLQKFYQMVLFHFIFIMNIFFTLFKK